MVRILQVFPSGEGVLSPDPDFLQEDIPTMSANRKKEIFFMILELGDKLWIKAGSLLKFTI